MMLSTDGYAYLNIKDPVCAWATYRGILVSAGVAADSGEAGLVSLMSAGLMHSGRQSRLSNELILERVRRATHPNRVSRLSGMYCFLDIESAQRASALWGSLRNHFRPDYLAELNLQTSFSRDQLDSNWISFSARDENGFFLADDLGWIDLYWSGEPFPDKLPIWETLLEGRMVVLGTDLRERAYDVIKEKFPNSLAFLEIARLAAWAGSDLGNTAAWLVEEGDHVALQYHLDMRDASNPDFLKRLDQLKAENHPINWNDLRPHLEKGSFGNVPDLLPYGFRRPKSAMPYLAPATKEIDHKVGIARGYTMTGTANDFFRIQGRLNALENLLSLLVLDRANVSESPHVWIKEYVANLRRDANYVASGPVPTLDAARLASETRQAILELADMIEARLSEAGVVSGSS
jgi:hypothetical protein